jgi:hypothetical protein
MRRWNLNNITSSLSLFFIFIFIFLNFNFNCAMILKRENSSRKSETNNNSKLSIMQSNKWKSWRTLSPSPPTNFLGEVDSGSGSCPSRKSKIYGPNQKLLAALPTLKNPLLLHLGGHLSTNPILSALHLQDPNFNIHVHFHWVNKQLIWISFSKWNHQ